MAITYNEKSIKHLDGLKAIRAKPGMYLGRPDSDGLFTIIREPLDNTRDEFLAGRNDYAHVVIDKPNKTIYVLDHGQGIPVGDIEIDSVGGKVKMPTLQAVVSLLHAGGKFDGDQGAYSDGSAGCFVADTEIRLLDGTKTTFGALHKRWQTNKSPIPVMSWDTDKDQMSFSHISHVQLSKYVNELIEVEIGKKRIRCTVDHPFYVRTNSGKIKKVEAQNLKPGYSLVAMHLKQDSDGYILDGKSHHHGRIHRHVYSYYNPDVDMKGKQVHHINGNRKDNRIENLELLTSKEHQLEHFESYLELLHGVKNKKQLKQFINNYNWSVKSVKLVKVESTPVYGITVDNYHTYFIQPGVLVANTHGIGVKATNAMSKTFDVWTKRNNKIFHIGFQHGKLVQPMEVVTSWPKLPLNVKMGKQGTIVAFSPDLTLFEKGTRLNIDAIKEWSELAANLNGGFKIDVTDETGTTTYYAPDGIASYVDKLLEKLSSPALGNYLTASNKYYEISVAFTEFDGIGLQGYTNGLSNPGGGIHVDTVLAIIGKKLMEFKGAKQEFRQPDLYEGIVGIVNFKIATPSFSNQVKDKLIDARIPPLLEKEFVDIVDKFFNKEKALAKKLCERAANLRKLKDEFKTNKAALRELKAASKGKLPPKLIQAKCNPGERELFLLEGDSAGGSAQMARDRKYQEILPLRGKVKNAYKVSKGNNVWDSEAIMDILKAIGYNPEAENPLENLRVGKLILLGDSDVDGWHVNLLNLSLIAKLIPQMLEQGMVYVAKGSEYVIETDKKNYYADSVTEMKRIAPASLHKSISHIKGWGEVSAKALCDMAFDPTTRKLTQLKLTKTCINQLARMMGEDVQIRRNILGL